MNLRLHGQACRRVELVMYENKTKMGGTRFIPLCQPRYNSIYEIK